MPYMCCVPNCKGNYKTGPKVQVFGFPKNEELRKKWTHAIKRDGFTPSNTSKVCELHFKPEDIRRTTSAFDEKLGKSLSYPLKVPQLLPGAMPTLFPNCPAYLSKPATCSRSSRDIKNKMVEEKQIAAAIAQSKQEHELMLKKNECASLDALRSEIAPPVPWHVVSENGKLIICSIEHFSDDQVPTMDPVVVINEMLQLNVYIKSVKLPKIGDHSLPATISSMQTVYNILDAIQSLLSTSNAANPKPKAIDALTTVLLLILSLLQPFKDQVENYGNAIWFICEQLTLIVNKQTSYSAQFAVFSSLFYNVSPHAYRFLRNSGNCLLPSYSTVRRVTLSCPLSPSEEQTNETFLLYIANKFKSLSICDKTITLLIDEIHIKPYFDYKGGNVVGAAYDSSDAATSAFAFMVNSVFSKFKEVVH